MLKKLLTYLLFIFFAFCFHAGLFASTDFGSPVLGVSLGLSFDSNSIDGYGYEKESENFFANIRKEFFNYDEDNYFIGNYFYRKKDYTSSALVGWALSEKSIFGFEFGYSNFNFRPKDAKKNQSNTGVNSSLFSQYYDIDVNYVAARFDFNREIVKNFNFILCAHIGVADVLPRFYLADGSKVNGYDGRFVDFVEHNIFKNKVLGLRSGFEYKISDSLFFDFNYMLNVLPDIKNKHIRVVTKDREQIEIFFADLSLSAHTLEAGFKFLLKPF